MNCTRSWCFVKKIKIKIFCQKIKAPFMVPGKVSIVKHLPVLVYLFEPSINSSNTLVSPQIFLVHA